MHKKLITDGAKTIANRVVTMNNSGCSVVECEELVADQISSFIKMMKVESLRLLSN